MKKKFLLSQKMAHFLLSAANYLLEVKKNVRLHAIARKKKCNKIRATIESGTAFNEFELRR